jgi:hypothetical protein
MEHDGDYDNCKQKGDGLADHESDSAKGLPSYESLATAFTRYTLLKLWRYISITIIKYTRKETARLNCKDRLLFFSRR